MGSLAESPIAVSLDMSDLDVSELSILLCCRDDWESLEFVLGELRSCLVPYSQLVSRIRILVVDDSESGSRSEQVLNSLFAPAERAWLSVEIVSGPRAGLSAATSFGLMEISSRWPETFVLMLDCDGQHDIRAGHELLRLAIVTKTDCVIGSRWLRGGSAPGLSRRRVFFSKAARIPLRMAGVPRSVSDPTTSFRCYSPSALSFLGRDALGFGGFSVFPGMVALLAARGLAIREIPITFRPRLVGESSLSIRVALRTLAAVPTVYGRSLMVRRRSQWFESSSDASYVGSEELDALELAVKFRQYVASISGSRFAGEGLEIGSGKGSSAQALLDRASIDGVPLSLSLMEPDDQLRIGLVGRFGNDDRIRRIGKSLDEFKDSRFRTIWLFSVLEHILDDIAFLDELRSLLEPGGVLIVFVPRMPGIYGTVDGSSGHFRRYGHKELALVAQLAGFEVIQTRCVDAVGWFPYWANYVVRQKRKISRRVVVLADHMIVPAVRLLDRLPFVPLMVSKNLLVSLKPVGHFEGQV